MRRKVAIVKAILCLFARFLLAFLGFCVLLNLGSSGRRIIHDIFFAVLFRRRRASSG
jgi:hypothetical protein